MLGNRGGEWVFLSPPALQSLVVAIVGEMGWSCGGKALPLLLGYVAPSEERRSTSVVDS